jgi:hypothetical protein
LASRGDGRVPTTTSAMGHVVPGMGTAYREKVSDEWLGAVCEHVMGIALREGEEAEAEVTGTGRPRNATV